MNKRCRIRLLDSFSGNRKSAPRTKSVPADGNPKWIVVVAIAVVFAMCGVAAQAQQAKPNRLGVILQGGPYYDVLSGLRDGLKDLRLEEGKHVVLEIRDTKGDLKAVEEAARNFEREKVDLIFAVTTSVTIAVKRVTSNIPIIFYAGTDPVAIGLVESFSHPGGRLTGVHNQTTDLTAKRLEILKEMLPKARRIVTFYNSSNRVAAEAAKLGREASGQMGLQLIERHVATVEELQSSVRALKVREADAYILLSDAMVISQAQLIIDTAKTLKLPTMFHEGNLVANGGLASYGISYHRAGRTSAKYVQRILAGTNPKDLPVETIDKLDLVFNLPTARQIGLTIPPSLLYRADRVIK